MIMGNYTNILISGIGGGGAVNIVKNLKGNPNYNIIAIDANKYAVGLYLFENSYIVPYIGDSGYKSYLLEIIKKHDIDIYIPLIDEEIEIAYEIKEEYDNFQILAPNLDFCKKMLNKWEMYKIFKEKELPIPKTYLLNDKDQIEFDTKKIIKPIYGRGSRGIEIISSYKELEAYLTLSKYSEKELLIQDLIEGTEYTTSAVVDKDGEVLSVIPKRIIKKDGITHIAVTEKNEVIEYVCKKIQEKLQANGPFNVQLIIKDGKPYIFEINPRFSTSVTLTMESGINEVDILIKDLMNYPYTVSDFESGVIMSRYYDQIYFTEEDIYEK